jgi:hypothetical protein
LRHVDSRLAPDLLTRRGIGPVSAAAAIVAWSNPGSLPNQRSLRRARRRQPHPSQQRPGGALPTQPRRRPATEQSAPHHREHPAGATAPAPPPTSNDAELRAKATARSAACSSATSPASYIEPSTRHPSQLDRQKRHEASRLEGPGSLPWRTTASRTSSPTG